jgi:hypothetical protein
MRNISVFTYGENPLLIIYEKFEGNFVVVCLVENCVEDFSIRRAAVNVLNKQP